LFSLPSGGSSRSSLPTTNSKFSFSFSPPRFPGDDFPGMCSQTPFYLMKLLPVPLYPFSLYTITVFAATPLALASSLPQKFGDSSSGTFPPPIFEGNILSFFSTNARPYFFVPFSWSEVPFCSFLPFFRNPRRNFFLPFLHRKGARCVTPIM